MGTTKHGADRSTITILVAKMAAGEVTGAKRSEDTTLVALESASKLRVTDENGQNIEFGSLFKSDKVIVIFVRVGLLRLYFLARTKYISIASTQGVTNSWVYGFRNLCILV